MKETQELIKEIETWNKIEKELDECPKENYEEFTRLEKIWMNCPIDKLYAIAKERLSNFKQWLKQVEDEIKFFNGEVDYKTEIDLDKIDEKEYPLLYKLTILLQSQNERFKNKIQELTTLKEDLIKEIKKLEEVQ